MGHLFQASLGTDGLLRSVGNQTVASGAIDNGSSAGIGVVAT